MSVRECVIKGQISSEHVVQFFDSDESRAECVAAFLAEGYRAGEPLIVVARPGHWSSMAERLQALKVPVQKAINQGKLVVKDADDTLRRLSRNGSPDQILFDQGVGKVIEGLKTRGGRVRAYGEMVDMLAQRGDLTDAIRLEEMWNRLGERASFYLMCGYSAAHFVSTSTHRALREICSSHTSVHRHSQDPLATWLLTAAHNRPEASSSATALQN
jgi:MEDS: MEthanogen/methylotroph, DcmR Sensory domain